MPSRFSVATALPTFCMPGCVRCGLCAYLPFMLPHQRQPWKLFVVGVLLAIGTTNGEAPKTFRNNPRRRSDQITEATGRRDYRTEVERRTAHWRALSVNNFWQKDWMICSNAAMLDCSGESNGRRLRFSRYDTLMLASAFNLLFFVWMIHLQQAGGINFAEGTTAWMGWYRPWYCAVPIKLHHTSNLYQ